MKLPSWIRWCVRTWLWPWAHRVIHLRPASQIIGPADDPFLLRWYIVPHNQFLNVYLHWILRSDNDRALHDHPWAFVSIVLAGSYTEVSIADSDVERWQALLRLGCGCNLERREAYSVGTVLVRAPRTPHRIELDPIVSCAVSLVITGPKVRPWGFFCRSGWVPWRDYTVSPDCE